MKIAHLSSVHPAGDPRITVKECRTLAAAGHDVVLICPHPTDETVNGVRVVGLTRRRGRLARAILGTADVYRAARREGADVFHFHDPELLPVGVALRLGGAAVVYDAHEDLPRQILAKPWIPGVLRRPMSLAAELVESTLARMVSGVVAATPQIARRFPAGRTATVQNFAIIDELVPRSATPYASRPNQFVYIGGIAAIRGAFEMVAAVALLPEALRCRLVLAGLASDERLLKTLESEAGWKHVEFRGWLSREQVAKALDQARAGLLLLHPTANYLESYPVKAFEYMTAGLPLVVSDFPLWRELFDDVGCAMFVDPRDPRAIARALQWIIENPEEAARMGARGRAAVSTRFNWQAEAVKLLSFYDTLPAQSQARMIRTRLRDA